MGSRRRTYTDLVDVVSYTYVFQYKNSNGSWVNIGGNTSVNLGTVAASGGNSSISIRHYREKYVNGLFTSNDVADLSYSLPSGVTKTQSGSVSNNYVSIFRYSYGNNTSTNSRTLSTSITCNGNKITASMTQSAGSKSYGSWSSWSVSVSNSGSVSASGGSSTISRSASRYRVWTWNGVSGSGATEYEYDTNNSISYDSSSSDIKDVTFQYTGSTENGYIAMYTVEITGLGMNLAVKFKLSRSVGGKTEFTINNVRKATMIGFIKISNNRFNSADRMTIYKNSEYAGYTYPTSSQYAYIPVLGGEGLVIYTTDSLIRNGFTSFEFIMGADTSGSLSNVNAKDVVQTAAKINSYPSLDHTRVSVTPYSSTSNYTLICQFTFYLGNDPKKKWNITMSKKI